MHDFPANPTDSKLVPDREYFEDEHPPEQEAWYRDRRYADRGLQDGTFNKYRGFVVAIYEMEIVGKGKNPLHLRRRVAKKLGIHPLRTVLVDPDYGVL